MIERGGLRGVWAAALTPVDARLRPDAFKAIPYYRDLLARGCDGINVFGTTGEAMSFNVATRLEFMQQLARAGLPMERIMVGTGAASLDDAAALTSAAFELGFTAALILPPFFFRDAVDDGIVRFYDELFRRAAAGPVVLYNFPLMSGITFRPDLVARLVTEFPDRIVGVKDSSNDRQLQRDVLARNPELAVFPGSEAYLLRALADGAAGCISGSVALWPELAQSVYQHRLDADGEQLAVYRATLNGLPFIPAVRYGVARSRDDDCWERPMIPLQQLSATDREELQRRLSIGGWAGYGRDVHHRN